MRCHYCDRPVRMIDLRRHRLLHKFLPYCGACHRYVLTWAHIIVFAVLSVVALGMLVNLAGFY
ncbi:MAG: hypothetical protein ABR577_15070 [Pyrinomonadaceae bacterium]